MADNGTLPGAQAIPVSDTAYARFAPGGAVPFWGLNDDGFSSNDAPLFSTDPWDTFFLGGRQLPGECELQGAQIARIEVNKKKGKGSDYTRITLTGYEAREFQIVCQVATSQQWGVLQDIMDVYWRIAGKDATSFQQSSLDVGHPGLAALKIYVAVLIGITPPTPGKIEGTKNVTFTFHEVPLAQSKKKNVTKSAGPPAQDKRKPLAGTLANQAPTPPSSEASNLGTSGPKSQFQTPAGAE